MWCISEITPEFEERMMDVLEVYERAYNPKEPVVCVDEKSVALHKEIREPIPVQQGSARKVDSEYERNGTANIFMAVEPKGCHRDVEVTAKRKKPDFAKFIKQLLETTYREAEKVIFVLDNLNTHFEKSFHDTFSKQEAKKLLERIEFHHTPCHASWLDMAEIELSVLSKQCLNRRIGTRQGLKRQVHAWAKQRNKKGIGITWQFTREKAKEKFKLGDSSKMTK